MQNNGLSLADAVDCELFQRAFDKHAVDFGDDEDAVYTPAITLMGVGRE